MGGKKRVDQIRAGTGCRNFPGKIEGVKRDRNSDGNSEKVN